MDRPAPRHPIKLWRADDLGAAELLRGRFVDHRYDPHAHETLCLALITGGALRIRMHGAEFVATKGDVVAINAEVVHAGWPIDDFGWKMRTLHARPAALAACLDDDGAGKPRDLGGPVIRDRVLAGALFGVHACSEGNGPALKREERYLALVARLFARHARDPIVLPEPDRDAGAVGRARALIDDNLDQPVRLSDLARAAELPRFRLFRAFVRTVGMPPHAYQRQARVRAAADLIRRGDRLSEVAGATGFADQAHLTRTFRRIVGATPGVYRAAFAGSARG